VVWGEEEAGGCSNNGFGSEQAKVEHSKMCRVLGHRNTGLSLPLPLHSASEAVEVAIVGVVEIAMAAVVALWHLSLWDRAGLARLMEPLYMYL
jgi:hypothetical protein